MKDNKYNYNNQTGMFRNLISINKLEIVQDEIMQDIEVASLYGRYWAMIKTNRAVDRFQSDEQTTEETIRFVIKYAKSLDEFINSDKTRFKISHKGNEYEVVEAINDNELNQTITILVRGVL